MVVMVTRETTMPVMTFLPEHGEGEATDQRAAGEAAQGEGGVQDEGDLATEVGREDQCGGPEDGGKLTAAQEEGLATPGQEVFDEIHSGNRGQ